MPHNNQQPRQGLGKASHVPLIEFDSAALKQRQIFLPKRMRSMMLVLLLNVTANIFQLRGEALTVKAPYPSCHENEQTPTSSCTHLDETDFSSRSISANVCVARRPTSKCTWSATPPIASGAPPSVRITPPR